MLHTQLSPEDIRSLKSERECLIENIICAWMENLADTNAAQSPQDANDDNSNSAPAAARRGIVMNANGDEAFLLISDFSLLHAAAQFNEPSMLSEFFQTQLLPTTPTFHTLWVLSGLADFWSGDEDGEHYSAVLMRITLPIDSRSVTSGSEGASLVQAAQDDTVNGATPSAPSSPLPTEQKVFVAAPQSPSKSLDVFLFDSSNQKNLLLASRLVRLVTNAINVTPQLKDWYSSGSACGPGSAAIWAWNGSPAQQSAVGCGVFMSAHLEQLCQSFVDGTRRPPTLIDLCSAIQVQHRSSPTLTLKLEAGNDASTHGAPCGGLAQDRADEITSAYLRRYFAAGEGRSFEASYRKYMVTTLGV